MTIEMARHGDIELAYETLGPPDGEPLLLIQGIGQLIGWPDEFCAALAARGFRLARFDNRDAGESTHLHDAGRPGKLALLLRPSTAAPYRLSDMAADALAVLDALGWDSAHLVGIAQGGMIAQSIATHQPDRVRSLTSISSTPSPRIGRPGLRTVGRILAVARRPITTREQYAAHLVALAPLTETSRYPADLEWLRELGRRSFDRGHDQAGLERQSAAFQASGDRRGELATVRAPTVVLHGEADLLVGVAGGRATAAAIPGARLVTYPEMGNVLPRPLWPDIVEEIATVAHTLPGRAPTGS